MANRKVTLYRHCKTENGWKRYPVVMSANGRVKPNAVRIGETEAVYPEGRYELRCYVGTKTVWTPVVGNATEALAALTVANRKALAKIEAGDVGLHIEDSNPERASLKVLAKRFYEAAKDRGSLEAAEIYERTLDDFLLGCTKQYPDELKHDDVLRFHRRMRERGLSARTVANRHMNLRAFFLYLKFDKDKVKEIAGPKPKFEKTLPEIYEPAELKTFFKSLTDDYDKLLFDVLLQCGLREREAAHLEWTDISKSRHTLKVQSKPRWNHKVKDSEEREVPVSKELLDRLNAYHEKHKGHALIFGKNGGVDDEPDGHLLRRLKALVRDAKLNCGSCKSCIGSSECEKWFLHKFRATYCTQLLRSGLDLRSVQHLMGHSDLASTMRYLRPAEGDIVQKRVNSIKWH